MSLAGRLRPAVATDTDRFGVSENKVTCPRLRSLTQTPPGDRRGPPARVMTRIKKTTTGGGGGQGQPAAWVIIS